MHYDFDQIIDRSRNHSAKYDERKKKFGTDDVIPSRPPSPSSTL